MDTTQLAAVAAALGWASGLRLYAVVFLTTLVAYRSITGLAWREFLPTPARLRALTTEPEPPGDAGSQ